MLDGADARCPCRWRAALNELPAVLEKFHRILLIQSIFTLKSFEKLHFIQISLFFEEFITVFA